MKVNTVESVSSGISDAESIDPQLMKILDDAIKNPKLIALTAGFRQVGVGNSAGYEWTRQGRFVSPIRVGRSSKIYEHEPKVIAASLGVNSHENNERQVALVALLHKFRLKIGRAWEAAISAAAA